MAAEMKYTEQWMRTERWFERFKDIDHGKHQNLPSECFQDDAYAFFINCHQLKDWIKNDPLLAHVKPKVEAFINANECLQLCADICNGNKHLLLTSCRSQENPQFGARHYNVQIGPQEQTIHVKYEINTSSGTMDAFEIASQCMIAWHNFIQSEIVL